MRRCLLLLALGAERAHAQGLESLWYLRGEESIQAFLAHADQISIVSPQVFVMDSTGMIRGSVDPRVVATARAKGVKLIPLVMNPGFDQPSIHRVLTDPVARAQALRSLAELCRVNRFDGLQFDFENFHVSDRDAFTSFTRAAVDSVHRAGCSLSAAVVPRMSDDPGTNSYDRWIYDNWRGGFDYKALADTLDFISYMTYAQHTGGSSPGPVAGYPWMLACLDYVLKLGVPPGKISLGLAGYSDWWYPTFDERNGARLSGSDIPYTRGRELLAQAGVTASWDTVQLASYAMWESHGVFQHLWLEDARAFMAKRRLAVERGLRGYSVWLLGSEDPAVWATLRDVAPTARDSLRLYYVGRAVGYETYDLSPEGAGFRLTADFSYVDRGRPTHLTGVMRVSADYTPELLEISRLADTVATLETRVEVGGRDATVFARGAVARVKLPSPAFAISAHAPVSQHLLLMRYWLAHGEPRSLEVVPGGPTNRVTIEWRGRDTVPEGGKRAELDRYAVNGVAWGYETVWLDAERRIAGLATRAGNLTFAAVRVALTSSYARLMASATSDRLADLASLSAPVKPVASGTVALVGVTLIDGTGKDAVPNATVVVSGGRIVAAGASVTVPAGARRLDMRGKTIMPGLWDMHAHLTQVERAPGYLAVGVTTVRDMGSELDFITSFRSAVDSGRGLGPRMLLAGLVDGAGPNGFGEVSAETPDEGRAVVRKYHGLGFEQIKLYGLLAPGVVGAITREAHRLGMTVTGHVPRALGLLAAIDSGQDQVAHLPFRGDESPDAVQRVIAALKQHGTVMDPTLSWNELNAHSTQEPVQGLVPGARRLPPVLAQRIEAMGRSSVDSVTAHAQQALELALVKALHEAGIPVVAGTDMGVPGFSIIREVELYERAGFSRMEALRAATAIPAQVMNLSDDVGTLEAGKRADLIVLDANPLDGLRNLYLVHFVMKGGVLYRTSDIAQAIGFGR